MSVWLMLRSPGSQEFIDLDKVSRVFFDMVQKPAEGGILDDVGRAQMVDVPRASVFFGGQEAKDARVFLGATAVQLNELWSSFTQPQPVPANMAEALAPVSIKRNSRH